MRFLSTFVACCGVEEWSPDVLNERNDKSMTASLVREKKVVSGGKSGRPPVQWRPSLCTIYEDDVVKTKRIQVYVPKYTPVGYKQEFVLRGSWDMISPLSTSYLF